jgi:RNA polymerase sigma factor (sigma-70 family)
MQRQDESQSGIQFVMNPGSDEELMLSVREGGGEMLGVLFDRYQVPLFNFYSKLTGDRAASEDLVQEVFLRILKYRRTYRPDKPFRSWIYQIARNTRLDHVRKKRPETSWEPELTAPAPQGIDTAQQNQELALLQRALMQMSEAQREILVLTRFQELDYGEVGQLLGCEAGTVKVRVHRALRELREIFRGLESARPSAPGSTRGRDQRIDGATPKRPSGSWQ